LILVKSNQRELRETINCLVIKGGTMEELQALVSRLKAIVTEIEAVLSSGTKPKKLSKDEYLSKPEEERAKYDKEQMEKEPEKEEEEE